MKISKKVILAFLFVGCLFLHFSDSSNIVRTVRPSRRGGRRGGRDNELPWDDFDRILPPKKRKKDEDKPLHDNTVRKSIFNKRKLNFNKNKDLDLHFFDGKVIEFGGKRLKIRMLKEEESFSIRTPTAVVGVRG